MLLRLVQTLADRFAWIVLLAVLVGIVAPQFAVQVAPALMGSLMGLFALSFLISDSTMLRAELANWRRLSWMMLFVVLARGSLGYGLARLGLWAFGLPSAWALPALLVYACPPAGVTPTLALLFGARFERTVFVTTVSTLVAPLVVPALLSLWAGDGVRVEGALMARDLGLLILAPLAIAMLLRRMAPPLVGRLRPFVPGLSTALLFVILVGAIGTAARSLGADTDWASLATPIAFAALLMATLTGLSWLAVGLMGGGPVQRADRLSLALLCAWPNIGLAFVVGAQIFVGAQAELMRILIAALVPWALALGPARALARRAAEGQADQSCDAAVSSAHTP